MPRLTTNDQLAALSDAEFLARFDLTEEVEIQAAYDELKAVESGQRTAREACLRMLFMGMTGRFPTEHMTLEHLDEAMGTSPEALAADTGQPTEVIDAPSA